MSRKRSKGFGPRDIGRVARAMEVAEESVSEHFQLSDGAWLRYPYELRTLAELAPVEVSNQALAQVLRLRRPPTGARLRPKDFFRICLQDHNLAELVEREKVWELMDPLLVYVLAHELVHVVRFYRFHHLFEASAEEMEREEGRVHAITAEALKRVPLPNMDRVLNLYQEHGRDEFITADC